MSMPRLLKKFSRKSLRKRTKSVASSSDIPFDPEVPPLPIPQSAASDASYGFAVPKTANGSSLADAYADKPSPPTPKTRTAPLVLSGTPQPPLPNGNAVPEDDLSKDLLGAWKSATTDPKVSKADKVLLQLENGVAGAMAKETQGAVIMTGIKTGLEAVGGMEAIEKGLNSFMEGMPVLMNALDEVAKLHPFIGVAVMAFKAVWALEQKRRANDKMILTLHMEMKDMMAVLTQLKNVKDAEEIAPDGSSIKGRMQGILKGTADDIKACANACDTYSKKRLVVKVLKGPIWEGKLVKFVGIFTKRRGEFEFSLSIHTALGVDAANAALKAVDQTTAEMNAKMDMMLKMFQQFVSPEQKEMARQIQQRGGQAVIDNDKALKELNDWENKSGGAQGSPATHAGKSAKPADLDDLKDDLHTDPDTAMEQNMTVFTRKFEVQKRQIIDELSRVVERQGDRIISAVTAGPHDKIIDPNVHAIWKEMGWRGSVKARHFVMALRDHFQEDHPKHADGQPHDHAPITVDRADEWALEYISVVRLQPISEAFDDDASGFVTVAEVNSFTTARPIDWSLPRWIAYWAVGHHQVMTSYVNRIGALLGKMFGIISKILPANKSSVDAYLTSIYEGVYTLTASVNGCWANESLNEKFASYIEAEEARIRGNLEAVQYDIDASDTLELVTGAGRIERYILPVLYLLLERHFEIFRVAQTRTLHADELWDAADTVQWVFDAVNARLELLQSIFKQQKLDLAQQFKGFSFGLYEYMNDLKLLWDPKLVQEAEFDEYTYDDSKEAQDIDMTKILNYPLDEEILDLAAYLPKASQMNNERPATLPMPAAESALGIWHGHVYWPSTYHSPSAGMLSMDFTPSTIQDDVQLFTAAERANFSEFTIAGKCSAGVEPDTVSVSFKRSFPTRFPAQYFTGVYDAATETLSGTLSMEEAPAAGQTHGAFVFKRFAPENVCFVPAPVELEANKPRALWAFAIGAVRYDIRRSRWSWMFFKERRDNRLRFIELYIRQMKFGKPMNQEEYDELARIKKIFTTADSRFYHSLATQQIRATTEHNCFCDNCGGNIGGARISCLVCQMKDTFNTVDFCSAPECVAARVMRDDMQKAHLPHHDLMKLRRVVHMRQFGKTYRNAKAALKHARTFFKSATGPAAALGNDSGSDSDTEDEEGHATVAIKRASQLPTLAVSIPQTSRPASTLGMPLSAVSTAPNPVSSGPPCFACHKPVSQPCWYCVQCVEATFICSECDAKPNVAFGDHDFHTHDLVRVQELVEEQDLSVEERLSELEDRFSKHEKNMEDRLGRMEAAVDVRMAKVEQLLEQLVLKLGKP
ncbi:hypothetical protein C8R47DRAFT_732752 [Mycena vitilis]|nr:hypothetical protein C8R47DRAFT_732752 [Mycena vitilis]